MNPLAVRRLRREVNPTVIIGPGWGDLASMEVLGLLGKDLPRVGFHASTESTRHGWRLVTPLRRRRLRHFDAILSYGTEATRLLLSNDGVDADRVVTGFNTVDVGAMAREVAIARSKSVPASVPHRFLFVGQLVPRKGADLAIQALADRRLADATLTIVGDGPQREPLTLLARSKRVEQRVTFRGLVPAAEMPAVFSEHHSLVMPSRQEVWGLVANEALAAGLHAIIGSPAGCASDLARQPGVWLVRPEPGAVADAMIASQNGWAGWLPDPPMIGIGPERLADDVLRAIEIAIRVHCKDGFSKTRPHGSNS